MYRITIELNKEYGYELIFNFKDTFGKDSKASFYQVCNELDIDLNETKKYLKQKFFLSKKYLTIHYFFQQKKRHYQQKITQKAYQ